MAAMRLGVGTRGGVRAGREVTVEDDVIGECAADDLLELVGCEAVVGRVAEDGLLALFGVAYVNLAMEGEPHGGLRGQAVVVDERLRHAVAETGEEVFKGDVFKEDGEAEFSHGGVRDGGGDEGAASLIGLGVDTDEVLIRVAKAHARGPRQAPGGTSHFPRTPSLRAGSPVWPPSPAAARWM